MTVIAYWGFDSGTSADETGNGHDGTDTNVTYGAPTPFGLKAAQFPGPVGGTPANKIALAAIALSAGAWSIQAWVRPTANSINPYEMLLGKNYPGVGNSGCGLYFASVVGAATQFAFGEFGNLKTFQLNPSGGLNNDYHVVCTLTGPAGTLKCYVNGVLQATFAGVTFANFNPDILGHDNSDPSGSPGQFQGSLKAPAIWDRVLTQAEVTALYNGGAGLPYGAAGFPDGPQPPPPPLPPITMQQPLQAQLPANVDFGLDIDASAGLNPYMTLVGGLANVGQALQHRLSTPRGGLPYDPNYGYDVRELLNETMSPQRQAQAHAAIAGECRKDERVQSCNVALNLQGTTLTLFINITTAAGPFRLVLAVTAVFVQLLAVTPS